ncbi:UNVERIFIED_CONTAM: hypothetical protein Sangu_1347700 [Sesamum angustifolium]|uniref:Bifunctional inhibitor/plant lipid transfer protein/seed storage helical domain-containing protein n=1 Tax=Sesamum angustifolium TaxID=2727405 RepID=A0AAW2N702_9LAMI
MAGWLKVLCVVCFLVIAGVGSVKGKGVCGRLSPDQEAVQLAPCAVAARDGKEPVSKSCCLQVKRIGQNARCLCAVLLSNAAKVAGVKPQVAISIPKRCGFAHRPVGYKCGRNLRPTLAGGIRYLKQNGVLRLNKRAIVAAGFVVEAYQLPFS